ncbi:primosomal protein N' [Buchnera aphidicola (Hormaphis cornu)]|nr:primosomal protein N' [Buchnera aphidicola (Hormaphis cornu)]
MYTKWVITTEGETISYEQLKKTPKQLYVLKILKKQSIFSYQLKDLNISKNILNQLYNKKLCYMMKSTTRLRKKTQYLLRTNATLQINSNDILMLEVIFKHKINFFVHVILGASDTLKKDIYLLLLLGILKRGLKVLILVSNRFRLYQLKKYIDYTLNTSVDTYHSKLSKNKQVLIWMKVSDKYPLILLATHKGVLLPFVKLGMIIIDQENDLSYKILGRWKYNVKNIAIVRAYKENIPIVLESSQPSIETLYNIDKKKFRAIYVTSQNKGNNLCKIVPKIIDLNKQCLQGLFSLDLIERTYDHLNRNHQVCFIVNGFKNVFTVLQCQICLNIFECEHCCQLCKFHNNSQELFCTSCFLLIQKPIICKVCGSLHFDFTTYNKDIIKIHMQNIFVNVPIFVISNADNPFFYASTRNRTEQINESSCIIVGTDRLIKESLFYNVTLIAFIDVDVFLYSNQFRSIEFFSQLYYSILNCFKEQKLEFIDVLIQTKNPNNVFLKNLLNQKYQSFALMLLQTRKKYNLPPFCCHVIIHAESKRNAHLMVFLMNYANFLVKYSRYSKDKLWTVGPYPLQFNKINSMFYSKMLLVHTSRLFVKKVLNKSLQFFNKFLIKKYIFLSFDLD